jgi:hypothetical protein
MDAMLKSRGMLGGAAPKTEYRKTGTDTVGKWTCEKYEGYQNNQKISELCTVDPKALGFVEGDFQVTQQLSDFVRAMNPQNADQIFMLGLGEAQGFTGLPVRRIYSIGPQQIISELTEISRQTFPDSLFAVPAGFQKQPLAPGR